MTPRTFPALTTAPASAGGDVMPKTKTKITKTA